MRGAYPGTPDRVVEWLLPVVEASVNYFIVSIPRVAYELDPLRQFAQEVMLRFQSA